MKVYSIIESIAGIKVVDDEFLILKIFHLRYDNISKGYYVRPEYMGQEAICIFDKEDPLSTFFHEIAHATGHESRLNRPTLRPENYSRNFMARCYEEQVAENTALRLLKHFDIVTPQRIKQCQEYLSSHSLHSSFIQNMHEDVDKAFNYIITHWLKDICFNPVAYEQQQMDKIKEFMKVA